MEFKNVKIFYIDNIYLNYRLSDIIGSKIKNACYINKDNKYFLENIGDRCLASSEGVILMNVFDNYTVKDLNKFYRDLYLLKDVSDKDIFICVLKKNVCDILVGILTEMFCVKNIEVENFTSDKLGQMIVRESV